MGEVVQAGVRLIWEISIPSSQFCCNLNLLQKKIIRSFFKKVPECYVRK
jgi:hypothetical protein